MHRFIHLIAVLFAISAAPANADADDLTGEVWSVCGLDGHSTWHDTRLVFTEHVSGPDGDSLVGYFDWQSSRGSAGREHFKGTLNADGALSLRGYSLEDDINIINSRYEAELANKGMVIANGVWLDGLPGTWAAVRDDGEGTAVQYCEPVNILS